MADKDHKDNQASMESPIPSPIPSYTDEEKELAQVIRADFDSGHFGSCVDKLRKLSKMRQGDGKVMHNLSVALYYQSECRTGDDIRRGLNQVCGKAQVSLGSSEPLEDADHAILFFNHAVISYHLKQYRETIRILEKLFQVIEPLEDCLAHRVLFLLIDSYLCTYQPERALGALNYLEKKLFGTDSKTQSGDKQNENSSGSSGKDSKDSGTGDDNSGNSANEKHRPRITQYKTRCYLQLKQMKVCKREIRSLVQHMGSSSTALFLKSNFEFLRQNYRKAIKLLNSAPQTSDFRQTGESIPVLYFNNLACIHFYMNKFHLGAYYARKALQENANALAELPKKQGKAHQLSGHRLHTVGMNKRYELLYNTGIQLLHAGRPMAAFECLTEAVQVFPSNPRLWLRIAECCIAANKATPSPESEGKGMPDSHRKGIVGNVVGTGAHRKIVLSPGAADNKYSSDGQSAAMPVATLEFASLCLCNALSLLPEDSAMVPHPPHQIPATRVSSRGSVSSDSSELSDVSGGKQAYPMSFPAPPGCALKAAEVSQLRCAILACSAYVSLTLGDNVLALEHSKQLLSQPKASGSYRFLGHLYAAEALINMDHIFDAIQHLSPDSVMDVSVLPPQEPGQGDRNDRFENDNQQGNNNTQGEGGMDMQAKVSIQHQYYPASIQTAKATMLFNLASAHALRSEWDKARKCLHQACTLVPPSDVPQQALFLAIYLELQTGNYSLALQMVKKQQLIPYIKNSSGDAGPNRQPQAGFGTIGSGLSSSGFHQGARGMFPGNAAPGSGFTGNAAPGSNKPMRAKDPWHN